MNDLIGHIIHPYEDDELTISNLIDILDLNIFNSKEKWDGQNLCFRILPTDIFYAKSPKQIKTAQTLTEFISDIKYPSFVNSIYRLHKDLEYLRSTFTSTEWDIFYNNYLSVELIDNQNSNLLLYDKNYIILHGAIQVDSLKMNYNIQSKARELLYFTIQSNPIIDMSIYKEYIDSTDMLSDISLFNIPTNIKLKELDGFIKSSVIEEFQCQEVKLLKNINFKHNISMENQSKIQNLRKNKSIYIQNQSIKDLYKTFDFDSISSVEGIVFFYNSKLYKFSGSYSNLNKINFKKRSL